MKRLGAQCLGVCGVAAAFAAVLGLGAVQHGSSTAGLAFARQTASAHAMGSSPPPTPYDPNLAAITVDYPEEGSIFPPEITPPTFLWRDASDSASVWTIDVTFTDGSAGIRAKSAGERLRIGEIDPRCVSASNELPKLTPQQAAARTWIPDAATWEAIKQPLDGASRHHHDHRIPRRASGPPRFPRRGGDCKPRRIRWERQSSTATCR